MEVTSILGFSEEGVHASAHEVHYSTIVYDNDGKARHIIFKKNKYPGSFGQQASELEACFTAVANVFSAPHRALKQDIVTDEQGRIVGVCSEHAAHALLNMRRSANPPVFLQPSKKFESTHEVSETEFLIWINSFSIPEVDAVDSEKAHRKWVDLAATEAFTQKYAARMNGYWNEQKRIDDFRRQGMGAEQIQDCIDYSRSLLTKGQIELGEIPDDFLMVSECLEKIFKIELLKYKCMSDPQASENIQQEINVDAFDVKKGFDFLDKLPQNFFARLMEQKSKGTVDIDMDSLADVFTTAYGLEEDDLHKGNIGYYVTEEIDPETQVKRPCFHFFKIDHDLMFSDKVMAARSARLANLAYSSLNFRITPRDLQDFPDLRDSGNHYWPTKKVVLAVGAKAYHSDMDRDAYKSLKNDKNFNNAKWLRFLKQAVMPQALVIKALEQPLENPEKNSEKASILAIVQRATASRISELRIALLEVPDFRTYLTEHFNEARKLIVNELQQQAEVLGCTAEEIEANSFEVDLMLKSMVDACPIHGLDTQDTALQIAIATRSYRCHETPRYFSKYLDNRNYLDQTALDHAIDHFNTACQRLEMPDLPDFEQNHYQNARTYYADVICDLDLHRAKHSVNKEDYTALVSKARAFNSSADLPVVTTLSEFKKVLSDIRSRPTNTLKQDKVIAVALLEKSNFTDKKELIKLRQELQRNEPSDPAFKFIKELRSEIWIIKKIRGVYGETTTSIAMKGCINRKLKEFKSHDELHAKDELELNTKPDLDQILEDSKGLRL